VAYDEATTAAADSPGDVSLRYCAVLALARAGASERAAEQLSSLQAELPEELDPRLAEDIAALRARLAKDRALEARDGRRLALARESAAQYEDIYVQLKRPYSCINAATMWLLGGNEQRSIDLARSARALVAPTDPNSSADVYWQAATEAEASLLLDDIAAARVALERAVVAAEADWAALGTTRRQLELICAAKGIDTEILDALSLPRVLHYCGHLISPDGAGGRFPASAESPVAAQIAAFLDGSGIGFGYGSLACGADILFAEALLERGAELHLTLPFGLEEFRAVSVRPGGEGWLPRFEHCLAGADTVTFATEGQYLNDDALFDYCARLAMGHATIRANFLRTEAVQAVVWDGAETRDRGGTSAEVELWRAQGGRTHVIAVGEDLPTRRVKIPRRPPSSRVIRAVLFADVHGFSRLGDLEVKTFLQTVMRPLAASLRDFEDHVLYRNSWGDGFYVVFRTVAAAAECALALQLTMRGIDLAARNLPEHLGLRIGAHAGPVFEAEDPIRGEPNYYGTEVTHAARLEPRTPEGQVYVTDAFAALVALEAPNRFQCEYVGRLPTAKDHGVFPMYVLKRLYLIRPRPVG
jgi:class 3 adenylate cyclase